MTNAPDTPPGCKHQALLALASAGVAGRDVHAIRMTANAPAGAVVDWEIMRWPPGVEPQIVARRIKSSCCSWCALRAWAEAYRA